jgi:biotin carboxyl carrier protein
VRREVRSPIAGSVWSHVASTGQRVKAGATLIIVESMKTEFAIEAPVDCIVLWLKPCGDEIKAEDVVATLEVG